jgi:hypothetical protein
MRRGLSVLFVAALLITAGHASDPLELNIVAGSPFYPGVPGPPGIFNRGMDTADFDGDGDTDVVMAERDGSRGGRMRLMLNNGQGALTWAGGFGGLFDASTIAAGDFNADGKMDAAVPRGGDLRPGSFFDPNHGPGFSGGVQWFYGNGAGGFTEAYTPIGPNGPCCFGAPYIHLATTDVAAADFDNDGDTDLAALVKGPSFGLVYSLRNNGGGSFTSQAINMPSGTGIPSGITAADVNGDNDPDLVVVSESGKVFVLFGQLGSALFGAFTNEVTVPGGVLPRLAGGDVDNDGDRDIVVRYETAVLLLKNNGSGVFSSGPSFGLGFGGDARIADLDGDGHGEIIAGSFSELAVLRYDAAANLLGHAAGSPLGPQTVWVATGRMNGGPAIDIIGASSFGLTVHINGPADSTPPEIDDVDDVTEEATGPDGASVEYDTPEATDDVDGEVEVMCLPASGSQFDLGSTEVTCSASDAAGNDSEISFNVIVEDTTAPAVEPLDDIVAEATGPGGADVAFDAPAATDAVDGDLATTCDPAGGTTFGLGPTTVTCSVTDDAGNDGATSFIVTVVDTTAPAVVAPEDVTAELTGPGGAAVNFDAATATDAVGVVSGPSCSAQSGDTFPLGSTVVNCTASDAAGHSTSDSFTVTVVDTTAPSLTLPPSITTAQTACPGTPVAIPASASDLSGAVTLVSDAPALYPAGTTTVTFTATDGSGNQVTGTVNVTVVDDTAPAIASAAPSQTSLWPPNGRLESIDVTWSLSDCDAGATCAIASVSSDEPAAGDWNIVDNDTVQLRAKRDGKGDGRVYTITIRCTDAAGNASTRAVTVAVPHDQRK